MSRQALIQHASTLPVGSPQRRQILAHLTRSAGFLSQDAWFDKDDGGGSLSLEVVVPLYAKAGQTWPGGDVIGRRMEELYRDIKTKVHVWSQDFENMGKQNGATVATVRVRESWTGLKAKGSNLVIQSHWAFESTFGVGRGEFWDHYTVGPQFKSVSRTHGFNLI